MTTVSRRGFCRALAGAGAVAQMPAAVRGAATAQTVKLGVIGCGWYGMVNVQAAFKAGAVDIRDANAMEAALATLPPAFRNIDLLVNNAGLAQGTAPAQHASLEDWRTMIDTNVTALVTLTHRLLPQLVERRGAIINISSTAALYPYPGGNAYGGTKAFVSQFSLGLRADLHGTGVRVTAIEPGMAETEFTLVRTHGNQNASDQLYKGANPMTAQDIAEQIFWVASLPPHLNINRLELMPVSQSFAGFQVAREG